MLVLRLQMICRFWVMTWKNICIVVWLGVNGGQRSQTFIAFILIYYICIKLHCSGFTSEKKTKTFNQLHRHKQISEGINSAKTGVKINTVQTIQLIVEMVEESQKPTAAFLSFWQNILLLSDVEPERFKDPDINITSSLCQ